MNRTNTSHPPAKRLAYGIIALCIATFSLPATAAHAEDTATAPPDASSETITSQPTDQEQPSPSPTPSQGPQAPQGPSGTTYTYNEDSGLWENGQYTWDPATNQTAPKEAPTYSYNPTTGHWDTTEWVYDPPSGTYKQNTTSSPAPPVSAPHSAKNPTVSATSDHTGSDTAPGTSPHAEAKNTSHTPSSAANSANTSGVFDKFYNALISNTITSSAVTGDAVVNMNTLAGDALSGDAAAIATILNLLQSAWGLGAPGAAITTFTQNLFGDILGDLMLELPTATSAMPSTAPRDIEVHSSDQTAINNTIDLEAISGDAAITNNTTAGSATSGNATVIANIINAINSSIVSGSSFMGMLNIYGSLDGDILLPDNLIDELIEANVLGTLNTDQINNADILQEFASTNSTTNTITTSATSGDAAVQNNTSAGNATSGQAETNVTILNLTGREVIGKNALLVFVNVLGSWVGMIVNAPSGATSAALGGDIVSNKAQATLESTTQQTITNGINAHAASGNATIANNTTAGDATSGNAMAAINVLNMNTSQFALSDWFGVLFINVFGSWRGSFGMDTEAGTITSMISPATPHHSDANIAIDTAAIKAFAFTPNEDGSYSLVPSSEGAAALTEAHVLGDDNGNTTDSPALQHAALQPESPNPFVSRTDWTLPLIGMALGTSLLGAERALNRRSLRSEGLNLNNKK